MLGAACRLQDKGVGTDQEWHSILQRPLFTTAADKTSAILAHLSEIFVERHQLVWKVEFPCISMHR